MHLVSIKNGSGLEGLAIGNCSASLSNQTSNRNNHVLCRVNVDTVEHYLLVCTFLSRASRLKRAETVHMSANQTSRI
eukprot:840954-Amphidinium_carterae.1